MSGESKKEVKDSIAEDVAHGTDTEQTKNKKKKNGVFSRIFNGIFRSRGDDFEKRLEYISKEEASILSRMKKRSHSWRGMTKNLIILSLALEVAAVGFAIMTTRSLELSWQMRAMRVLPMFIFPVLAFLIYSALGRLTRMRDRRDENNLEKLRAERQEKIDELKERTNYYFTQQLIQRYDPDPASQKAAANVLASKLCLDSGMKVYLGEEESMLGAPTEKNHDVELVQPGGLRNRKHSQTKGESVDGTVMDHAHSELLQSMELEGHGHHQMVVEHFQPTDSSTHDGSWISRLAALLVGEDPTQSYALICGNCHIHNGLARKEDYPYIMYYCPHCKALNRSKQQDELINGSSNLPTSTSSVAGVDGSVADIDEEGKGSESTGRPKAPAGEGITSVSSVIDSPSSISEIDNDSKGSGIDEDSKGSVVDAISTGSPTAAADEGITSASPATDAERTIASIDEDSKASAVDTVSTSSPVAAADEGSTGLSSVTGTAGSLPDIDEDRTGSTVDTISSDSAVAAAGEDSTKVESPRSPSSS